MEKQFVWLIAEHFNPVSGQRILSSFSGLSHENWDVWSLCVLGALADHLEAPVPLGNQSLRLVPSQLAPCLSTFPVVADPLRHK
jgi:hypothetical protein